MSNKNIIIKFPEQLAMEKEYEKLVTQEEQLQELIESFQKKLALIQQKKAETKQKIADWESKNNGITEPSYFKDKEKN